jgi:phospholipase/carboxylesterase
MIKNPQGYEYTVVLLHGFGADAADLFPLHQLADDDKVRWIFPNGPLEVPLGGAFMGRAWFPIDTQALDLAMSQGKFRDMASTRPKGLDQAKSSINELLFELNVPQEKLIIGGFSQGAMLATDVVMDMDENCLGLVLMSGTVLDQSNWQEKSKNRKDQAFFQSHGQSDPLLSFQMANLLTDILRSGGCIGNILPFEGAHEIPPLVLDRLSLFLRNQMTF